MLNPQTDTAWIDGFLQGQLSAIEITIFQERLRSDSDFSALFEEQKLLADGLRLARMTEQVRYFQGLNVLAEGEEILELEEEEIGEAVRLDRNLDVLARFKERGEELDKEKIKEEPKTKFTSILFTRYATIAATFLLLTIFWWANSNYSDDRIIKNLNEPFLDYQQAGISPKDDIMKTAKKDFFSGNYEKAVDNLILIKEEDGNIFYEAQGLLAYAYFNKTDYPNAINQFNLLIDDYYNSLSIEYQDKNRLRWTRLLAHLGNNQKDSPFFQEELAFFLNNKSEIYQQKAQLLQSKLDSNWRKLLLN